MDDYVYTDPNGAMLTIWANEVPGGPDPSALLQTEASDGESGVLVPPHKVPEVCRAIYRAAGQEPPELPEILDESEVTWLARAIYAHIHRRVPGPNGPDDVARDIARVVMLAGWRREVPGADDH